MSLFGPFPFNDHRLKWFYVLFRGKHMVGGMLFQKHISFFVCDIFIFVAQKLPWQNFIKTGGHKLRFWARWINQEIYLWLCVGSKHQPKFMVRGNLPKTWAFAVTLFRVSGNANVSFSIRQSSSIQLTITLRNKCDWSDYRTTHFKTIICEKGTYHIGDQRRLRSPSPVHTHSLSRTLAVRLKNIGN